MRVLHIAPEPCLESRFRSLFGDGYITGDLLDSRADVTMDVTAIPFPDRSFDFVYCSHVLEHVPDDRRAMREFLRVLDLGGMAMLLVPITAETTVEDHVRRYGPDYQDRLQDAGFHVTRIAPEALLTASEIFRYGVGPAAGDLFICTPAARP